MERAQIPLSHWRAAACDEMKALKCLVWQGAAFPLVPDFPMLAEGAAPAAGSPGMFLVGSPPTPSCQWMAKHSCSAPAHPGDVCRGFVSPASVTHPWHGQGALQAAQQDLWWQGFDSRKCSSPARSNKSQSSQARRRWCQHSKWQGVHALFFGGGGQANMIQFVFREAYTLLWCLIWQETAVPSCKLAKH